MIRRWLVVALMLLVPAFAGTEEPKKAEAKKEAKAEAKPGLVPFRLTDTHHTLVRVKINGKGPFNFIVDTGCVKRLSGSIVTNLNTPCCKRSVGTRGDRLQRHFFFLKPTRSTIAAARHA